MQDPSSMTVYSSLSLGIMPGKPKKKWHWSQPRPRTLKEHRLNLLAPWRIQRDRTVTEAVIEYTDTAFMGNGYGYVARKCHNENMPQLYAPILCLPNAKIHNVAAARPMPMEYPVPHSGIQPLTCLCL